MSNFFEINNDVFDIEISNKLESKLIEIINNNSRKINIAVSGGKTPIAIFEILKKKKIKWVIINFFLVDERCVNTCSNHSNFKNLNFHFFKHINSKCFPILFNGISFEKCADMYQNKLLENLPIDLNDCRFFDLVLLGMGQDGHTASLFPESSILKENGKLVSACYIDKSIGKRISFTYPIILSSKEAWLLTKGKEKKEILKSILKGFCNIDIYPVSKIIREHQNLKIFTT